MFRNIKKASEYSLLSEKLIYKIMGHGHKKGNEHEKPGIPELTEAEKTKGKLEKLHDETLHSLVNREEEVMKLLIEGDAYKLGDWDKLNKMFYEAMEVKGDMAEKYLKYTQKKVFEELGLIGDTYADDDGKLGPYTLHALALSFDLKRPKVAVPAGSPKLTALLNKDSDEAFDSYKKLDFAKSTNKWAFKKVYKDMMTNSYFNYKTAKLGDWVLALWKAGYKGDKAKKLGFPEMYDITDRYPYASEMELRMFIGGKLVFVDDQGKMFVYHKTKGVLELLRRFNTELFDKPKPDKKKKLPSEPVKKPEGKKEKTPEKHLENDSKLVADADKEPKELRTTG